MTQREINRRLAEAREQLDHVAKLVAHIGDALTRTNRALEELASALASSGYSAPHNQLHRESVADHGRLISQPSLVRSAQPMEQSNPVEVESPLDGHLEFGAPAIAVGQPPVSASSQAGGFSGFGGSWPATTPPTAGDGPGLSPTVPANRPVPAGGEAEMIRMFNDLLARSLADRIRPDPDAVLSALVAAGGPPCKGSRRAAGIPGYLELYLQDDQVLLFPPNNEIGDHTAYIGALFDLEKSLPSGSAIQVVQPARVALADLKYPPAPGMVRKGRIKLVG